MDSKRSITMTTIQGPAVFLAQFIGDKAPFNSLDGICQWAADLGFKGIQMPTLDPNFGTPEEVKNMVEKAHQHGIRIVFDGVINHTNTWFIQNIH